MIITTVSENQKKRGRPLRHRYYSNLGEIILEALKVSKGTRGFNRAVKAFMANFATGADAAKALSDYTGLEITEALLRKVANGQCDSNLVRKALDRQRDKRTDYRLRLSNERLHKLTTNSAAWDEFREELRRKLEQREEQP